MNAANGGTLAIATTADVDNLFPPIVLSTQARQATEMIYDYLAEVGRDMNVIGDAGFRPQLARDWRWSSDSLAITFRLHERARWHDGRPVRSDDVRFTHSVYTDKALGSSSGTQLGNIDSVTAPDSLTAVFWFRRRTPLQFFDATNQMMILPRHVFGGLKGDSLRRAAASIRPTGSGRFRFVRWNRGTSLELGADSLNYRGAAKLNRVIWSVSPSRATAATRLFAGEVDLYESMGRDGASQAALHPHVRLVSLQGTDYVFMPFNTRDPLDRRKPHPIFASREVRRALSMAIDRNALVRNVFDSLALPAIGPTVRAFPSTDNALKQIPYDTARAARTLDSLGWRRKSKDGIRQRNGRPLKFRLLVPSSSENRRRMAVLLQAQFRRIGADVELDQMEHATFVARQGAREFDAALSTFKLGSSAGALKETWGGAAARDTAGYNYGSWINTIFDAYVDSAMSAMDAGTSRRYYTAAYRIAIEDAPAIWLYEPLTVIGIHRRIKTGPMRADAWWVSLPEWHIPAAEQLPRDRLRQ
ncbi:MAG TPA: peptide ABC transporter substrate-binding protein [Gemmatimonadaceae bacterium]|nr:peptide ABC transporter substrate-binding protein [Gemmatimonadaceae bacterium]